MDDLRSSKAKFEKMTYYRPPLILEPTRLHDALGVIELSDLPDPEPSNKMRLKNATPLIERLWRIALSDVESNIVRLPDGSTYFGAGTGFGAQVYTRDISYSGILSLNRLYPGIMRQSLEHTRRVRLRLGFTVSRAHKVDGIEVNWAVEDISEEEFLAKYRTNSYTRRTDDVVWLWCAGNLFERYGSPDDWRWLYETGRECFQRLYDPFFDPEDGLYKGQASFIDIHYEDTKATGYPSEWTISDCVHIKATSTNCLYVKGLEVMGVAARKLGLADEAASWASRARSLKEAIRRELRFEDGTFAYFKDRSGRLEDRRDALGTALAVLLEVVTGEEAVQALRDYPVTDAGVSLFHPFYPVDNWYHNNSSWPFVDTLFLMASEKADGRDRIPLNLALLARVCRDGTFHEVVDLRNKEVRGSGGQLWTAAAFLGTCMRAGFELGRRS